MKLKLLIFLVFSLLLIFVSGCGYYVPDVSSEVSNEPVPEEVVKVIENVTVDEGVGVKEKTGCEVNADCEWGTFCIDTKCQKIDDLYVTEGCESKCNFNSVVIETSDKQTFTLNRGQGDYTAAGAVEWTLASGPDYCKGDDILVPVKIKKKNMGKVISEEYTVVNVGETSKVIKHPTIKSLAFTFNVKSVNEECS
jgi:hypothetical protein